MKMIASHFPGLGGLSGLSLARTSAPKRTSSYYNKVRTLARILSFYVETIFELIRVSNKVGPWVWLRIALVAPHHFWIFVFASHRSNLGMV